CVYLSSIRRHTRSKRDWSSDVCSSDLSAECGAGPETEMGDLLHIAVHNRFLSFCYKGKSVLQFFKKQFPFRSEDHAPGIPFEKRRTEAVLQFLDSAAYSRLADEQLLGGSGNISGFPGNIEYIIQRQILLHG